MNEDSDQALIERILAGGPDGKLAFRAIYDRYQRQVHSVCLRLVGDADRAADATQESFLAILHGLETFNFKSSFRTWLFQVSKNAALQMMRRASNRPFQSLSTGDPANQPGERGDDPGGRPRASSADGSTSWPLPVDAPTQLDSIIESEFEEDLKSALDRLNRQHAEILSLRYFGDCSYEELAGVLACSIGTVKSRLSRAHRALAPFLRDVLKKHGREWNEEAGPDGVDERGDE